MKPKSNIVYEIQYLTISFILDLQENIYKKQENLLRVGRRHVADFGKLNVDIFLEVQDKKYS